MAKTDNLSDFLTDVANSIRTKTQTSELINAQDFSDKILSIQSGSTLKNYLDAVNGDYLFTGYAGTSVDNIIQYSDTENITSTVGMFYECKNLTSVPLLDTGNITNMNTMFYHCDKLTTIPLLNTSNVTNMSGMFSDCKILTSVPLLDTSNVTNMDDMFYNC